jgi:hypothetical protein
MSFTWVAVLLVAFSLYSYFLVRRAAFIQTEVLVQFYDRVHKPNVLEVISEGEHEIIHDKLDNYHLRVFSCFIAALLAVCSTVLFIALVTNGGSSQVTGYILAIAFAYLAANYNMNSSFVQWMRRVENDLLARVINHKATDESLPEPSLDDFENTPLTVDEKQTLIGEEFHETLISEGFDPLRDYNETTESRQEFLRIFTNSAAKLNEKYTEPRGK